MIKNIFKLFFLLFGIFLCVDGAYSASFTPYFSDTGYSGKYVSQTVADPIAFAIADFLAKSLVVSYNFFNLETFAVAAWACAAVVAAAVCAAVAVATACAAAGGTVACVLPGGTVV